MDNLRRITLIFLVFFSCNRDKKVKTSESTLISFEKFDALNQVIGKGDIRSPLREGNKPTVMEDYLILNLHDIESATPKIDSFACTRKGAQLKDYYRYQITFYQKSEETNNENVLRDRSSEVWDYIDRDKLLLYKWYPSGKGSKFLYYGNFDTKKISCK